ncbi:hypothetical protein LTR10_016846 [Elasticomyces elasticus]|uniref:C2H2-type domain-containing protein n=1 Tax=Exophiala sideris TaxID=1016849 RepID=A0ABR0JK83_9EURO|nr:hypothetical protein LTR10_016846 [Elasticomyces elasticus]KAK5035384.1 hypothetical protein LTS07_002821 [Exophiala sideris]KAK5039265.1 hypothetical protein LTR13_003521 [Exophiala sideris]KAK5066308.1 hypothetical protein LTR69_002827 [Exophiala sideris]KAK5186985.1 hypothetical protein LTR44_000992 [Eurotiomycetes sp. CCFEE 6388]
MSGIEIGIAVVGAVAALITAYKDGGSIVNNIKARRKAKGALPPSVALEESLQEGQEEIERIAAKGIQRFGTEFEQGDDIAHRALQALTIEVQASFLHHLTLASKDDNMTDFETCIDSAIEARLKAVTILNELYIRQQKRSSLRSEPDLSVSRPLPQEVKEVSKDQRESKGPNEAKDLAEPKKRSNTLTTEVGTPPSPVRSRKSSWNVFKTLNRTPSTEETKENSRALTIPRSSTSKSTSPTLSPRATMSSSPGSMNLNDRRSQVMTPPLSPASTFSPADALAAAGLCKGAYYVQNGVYEKALQVAMKNLEWACHCKKCSFATPADRDERGRPRFDDSIHEASKLRFRSLLLFKSHLTPSQNTGRLYKCLICLLCGDSSSTFSGEQHLFEHITHHEGAVLAGVELYGPICLEPAGIRAGSERTFDLCFSNNPRLSRPPSAVELDDTGIAEADSLEVADNNEEVYKNQWLDEGRR